jgi:phosphatidylglycerophosphatase A
MTDSKPPKSFWKLAIITGLGTGYAPIASGTFGTLVGIPVVILLAKVSPLVYLLATALLLWYGIRLSDYGEAYFGKKDSGYIVLDEIVGYMVTMFMIPAEPVFLIAGFFVFRFFDITKPWPARALDQSDLGGAGVMLDDVAAGLYSAIVMHSVVRLAYYGLM